MKIFYLLIFLSILASAGEPTKKSLKEGKEQAKQAAKEIKASLLQKEPAKSYSMEDLLPVEERGKSFHPVKEPPKESELGSFLKSTTRREPLEGEEVFLQENTLVRKQANPSEIPIAEEERLEKCQETGIYQVAFSQQLIVKVTPEIKKENKKCRGHKIAGSKWMHKDDCPFCDHYTIHETILQPQTEEDFWQTDHPEGLSEVEANPACRLLYPQAVQGSETRTIDGKAIFREIWARDLFFFCEPDKASGCAQLRAQGGVLTARKCLKENMFGDCDLWEKTYDLSRIKSLPSHLALPEKDPLASIAHEFDTSYQKNADFGSVVSTLSVFSELKQNLEQTGTDFQADKVTVFNGESLKCQCSFVQGKIYDCCKKLDGLAVTIRLASCNTEEKTLAQMRDDGKCHYVGSQKKMLGTITEQAFCCFPTKLSRIVHEEGRKQLGIKWGSAEKPLCRGLSIHELQRIDFSRLDLSELLDEIRLDKEELRQKIQRTVQELKTKPAEQGRPVEEALEKQKRRISDEAG